MEGGSCRTSLGTVRYRSLTEDRIRFGLPSRPKLVLDVLGDFRASGREEDDAVVVP